MYRKNSLVSKLGRTNIKALIRSEPPQKKSYDIFEQLDALDAKVKEIQEEIQEMASVGAKVHISLDENLLSLKEALRSFGFKVTTFPQGTPDEELFHEMIQTLVLTKNVDDFKVDAVVYDFDIIDVRQIKFVDNDKTRKNETAQKIAKAIRESRITTKKGYHQLVIKNNGKWDLIPLF